jgi:predicted PurR-regulated permease PerM
MVKKETLTNTLSLQSIKVLLLLFLVIAGLYYAKDFLIPLAIGGILATLFLPLCQWLERKRIPPSMAALACLLLLVLGITLIIGMLGWQIAELINDVELIKEKAFASLEQIQLFIFSHFNISLKEQSQILKTQQNAITGMIAAVASSLTTLSTKSALTLVYVFLLLYYRSHLKNFILRFSSVTQQEETEKVIFNAARVSQQYLLGLSKMIFCLWIMYGIGFSLLGIKNPLFFAILCGLLEIVPFIGNITGTTITVLVSAVHGAEVGMMVGIVITYGAVQLIQGWILEPLILGPQVKINPLFTIVALVLGELIWGIPGMVLAIPLTAIAKIVCDHIESLRPFGFLIGDIEKPKTKHQFRKTRQ